MARWDKEGRKHPEMILCPHEVVAVHMAGGYALATGRGQAVLVHVDAGTANACMAIQNLFRYRLPVMLFAGRAPHTLHGELTGSRDTYVHFVQDPFDIASIVRPYVKWEYSLPSGVVVKEALARASAFAQSDPPGPVYMMLPRETLAEEWDDADMPAYPAARYGSVHAGRHRTGAGRGDRASIDGGGKSDRADGLSRPQAAKPSRCSTGWRGPAASASPNSIRSTSISRRIRRASPASIPLPLLEDADLGLLLDSDVPFVPQYAKRAGAIKWIQIDIDPLKSDFPMWGFPTDMRIQGDCAIVLQQVLDAVEARADDAYRHRVAARIASWSGAREQAGKAPRSRKRQQGRLGRAQPGLCVRDAERKTVAGRHRHQRGDPQRADPAGARHAHQAAELCRPCRRRAWIFAAAWRWGLKLAQPDRRIVQVIGDGGFHFSSPDSVYAVAQQYQIPILTVVLDNGGWQAVKSAVQRVYPKGIAAETDQFQSRLTSGRQGERRDFSAVARAFGAHGECVTEPDDLAAAIDRCLAALDDGKAAVLHVHVTRL